MTHAWRATRPAPDEFASFYAGYVSKAPDGDIVESLAAQIPETTTFLRSLPESAADHRYAPGKWSVREVIGHMSDAERVFAYRALRFSRGDRTPVPGFDEKHFVENAQFGKRSVDELARELEHLRHSTVYLFGGMDEEAMSRRGIANELEISVRALAFVILGHERHHLEVLRTRYL